MRGTQDLDRDINAKGGCVVWKYPVGAETTLRFAAGSIIRVDFDPAGNLCAWVLVFNRDREITRRVLVRGTGDDLPDGDWVYLNTFTRGAFVFHAFVGWVR